MRLGLVGPVPPPPGGMANQTQQLARLLRAAGIDVRLVRTNDSYRPAWVGSVRGLRAICRLVPYLSRLAALSREAEIVHVMANSGWAWFLFAAPAIHAAAARRVPVVVNYRGGLARQFLARSARRVVATLRLASAVVVPSRFLQEVFATKGIAARIIPNIVDLETFRPAMPLRPPGRHIVVVRNLETIYGIDTAIRAAAILRAHFPDLKVSVAGSGPERARLEGLSTRLGLAGTVHFTGRLDVSEVAALYRDADVALNPSRADNTPNSLLEAAASGVPIVSTNVGGVPYLVEHGRSAWLVPSDDPELMARGLADVLKDEMLRDTLRSNGSALARSCSWDVVGRQWLQLYEQVARDRGGRTLQAVPQK